MPVVGPGLTDGLGVGVYIKCAKCVGHGLEAPTGTHVYMHIAFGTVFGGDEYHTVGTTRPVDGCGGGIFQYLNGIDVLRIQEVGIGSHLHTVYHIERFGVAVDGAYTTDAYLCHGIGCAVLCRHEYAGGRTLQPLSQIDGRTLHHFGGVDGSHGTGDVAPLGRTVADDHHIAQGAVVCFERDNEVLPATHIHGLRFVAYVGDGKFGIGGGIHAELSVQIGDAAFLRTDHPDGSPDNRFARFVIH